jgi:holliday junction DNA helicase RuvA
MIGSLRGKLIAKHPPMVIFEVQGVGYEVAVSMQTLHELPQGQEILLQTHTVVREDAHELYGFSTLAEKQLFRYLIRVNGVGPKLALSILSSISIADFSRLVLTQDSGGLVKIPGIGKKMAERLIIEMADRLVDWEHESTGIDAEAGLLPDPQRDAINALVSLGYKLPQAKKVVLSFSDSSYSSETIIREALKKLAG